MSNIIQLLSLKVALLFHLLALCTFIANAQTSIIPLGSSWKYLDNGTNQGTAWRTTSFNDGSWKTGNGKFGYGISDATTTVSYGANAKKKYVTTYFRKSISIADAAAYASYTAKVKRDDGVVVYVNGVEVFRNNMPSGTVSYTTLANEASDNGTSSQSFTIRASAFTTGTNIIATEIHQAKANTPDMAFDLELVGNPVPPPPKDQTPPTVVSINRQNPTSETTSSTSLTFRTTFSEPVKGVDATDFTITTVSGTTSGAITTVSSASTTGTTYDVIISSVSGEGVIRLDLLNNGTGIVDAAGNVISEGFTSGQSYTIAPSSPPSSLPLNFKSTWKYLDNGSNQGTAWRSTSFDDGSWKVGNGKFGYGISDAATVVSYGSNASNKYITTYFRKSISIPDAAAFTSYAAKINRDDGVVVYINGAEVYRNNMPTGAISYTTLASGTSGGDDGATPIPFTIPASAFSSGTNVIAVEIHQANVTSSDIAFDMEVVGNSTPPPTNQPPVVSISNPANNTGFVLGQSVVIAATASDPDGSIAKVELYANGNKIGEDATSPHSYTWTPTSAGAYSLTAQAIDNVGATTISTSVSINVTSSSQSITPLFITEPVKYDSDDPAIWINKANPAESLIIATDKDTDGALYIYNMEGKIVPEKVIRNLQRPNNVDVEYGLMLQGNNVDIAVTTERYANKLRVFSLPEMLPIDNGGIDVFIGETGTGYREPMGISLYKRPSDGKIYAIVSRKSGPTDGTYLWQYLLEDDGQGNVQGTLVRKFGKYSGRQEIESVAVDDDLGYVYYSDERAGVRKYFADHLNGSQELAFFATTGFTADQEGIAIYKIEDGTGYILVNDQSANELHIFTREGTAANPHDHQLVKIVATATSESDGSEVANYPIPPHFPNGVFIGMSTDRTYQLYRWEDIAGNDLKIQPPQITFGQNQSLRESDLQVIEDHSSQLSIYPNPVQKGAVINIELNNSEISTIFVSDVKGRLVYSLKFTGTTSIETANLPSGMYIISLYGKDQLKKYKFIVTD